MDEKDQYIQWFLQNNPTASREQAELSYFTKKDLQDQIRRGYANPDGTLNSFVVDNVDEIDVRRPFGFYQNGQYYGPTVEDYVKDGLRVGDKGNYDIRTDKSNFNEELKYLYADKIRGHLRKNPNARVVAEYEGKPNMYNQMFNDKHAEYIKAGKLRPRHTGNDRHVVTVDENGKYSDLNLDMIPIFSGSVNGVEGLRGADYSIIMNPEENARMGRWRTISDEDGNIKPNYKKFIEDRASEKIKVNPDGTMTHYNPMRYHIPEVEAARVRNAHPDNLFSPSHIFADGGKMKQRRSEPSPETVDYFSRHAGTPMTIGELNRMREQYYAEQDEKARQEKEMRDFVIKQREKYFKKQEEDRLRMTEEARNRWFNGQPSTDTSDKTEEQPAETGSSKSWWLNPLSPEWLKIAYNPNPKQKNESVTTQPRTAQNSEASGKSNNQVANTNDEIDKLALDVIRGKYGNGKQRREALGDLYSVVQKRANEMLKGKRSNKNSSTRERQVADAYRKAWDETPEEYKQPLNSKTFDPRRIFNPRTYDLTTDDLRLHERAAQQARQSRSLDDDPHSLIRDNGEVKRRIGGTNNYDIYL